MSLLDNLHIRTVEIDDDTIDVYRFAEQFSQIYRNNNTRALDIVFGLNGEPFENASSPQARKVYGSLQYFDGHAPSGVEPTLDCFAGMAEYIGYFVGVKEMEFKAILRECGHPLDSFFQTIVWQDPLNHNAKYLYRVNVEGERVLFPANLRRQSQA